MSAINFNAYKSNAGKVSEQNFNRLVDLVQSTTLGNGAYYALKRTPAGTILDFKRGGGGGNLCPLTPAVSVTGANYSIRMSPGSVNNLMPSNMFSSFIVGTGTSPVYVKAVVASDGTKVTSSAFAVNTTPPVAQSPTASALPTSVEVLVAIVNSGIAYRTIGCGSVSLQGVEDYRLDKATAVAGSLAYTPYYAWKVV